MKGTVTNMMNTGTIVMSYAFAALSGMLFVSGIAVLTGGRRKA